ncbi:hypothetical protein V3C10_17830 [[Clostridium] symbiosum]|uniref:hypothetical protein n=1 Tax=Clostridium symbiosum TaxID=1512 RepID=UPI001D05E723|nr:hypothetical protein [[Clostridium] symbiosum]MCB6608044.1 hypothetical protein [[Clostridium] symbiosum]MCB6931116.1 hypothetical protein [[Clostridium] symbiosum]
MQIRSGGAGGKGFSVIADKTAESVEQITKNITRKSNIVQSNSATAEESAAASEELSGQAERLKSLVSTFKIKPN